MTALLASAALVAGCGRAPRTPPARRLVLITLDTTRADRLGCYGRRDAGVPWLDALAARGTRFERAYAQAPLTLPSHVSILTGLYPPHTGIRDNGQTELAPGVRTLAERLAAAGWFTAAAVGGYPVAARFPTRIGFETYDDQMIDARNPEGLERRAADVVQAALALAARAGSRPLFLWVHLFDPHDPYDPPSPYRERFAADLYQGEIASADAALSQLETGLTRVAGAAPTLFVVVGDHGEGLGEHGEETHGFFVYEPTMRVPLILAGPGVPVGRTLPGPVETVDLVPTLLALLGLPPAAGLDGQPLDLAGSGKQAPHRIYIETELPRLKYGWSALHGAVDGALKYIEAPRPELYDVVRDPAEADNKVAQGAPEMADLGRFVASVAAGAVREGAAAPDPALLSLGYVGMGPTRRGAGDDPKDRLGTYQRFTSAARALERGEPAKALGDLDRLLADGETAGVRFQRALALRMLRRLPDSGRELARVAALDPNFPGLAKERGRLALLRGDPAPALADLERSVAAAPRDAEGLMLRGAAREMLGDAAGAESDYRASRAINPAFDAPSLRLAALLVRAERFDEAKAVLREHLARRPDDPLASGLLRTLP